MRQLAREHDWFADALRQAFVDHRELCRKELQAEGDLLRREWELARAVLQRGYLAPDTKHELAAQELNLSRTAYFRRLRQASERVAAWVAERGVR